MWEKTKALCATKPEQRSPPEQPSSLVFFLTAREAEVIGEGGNGHCFRKEMTIFLEVVEHKDVIVCLK